MKIALSLVLGLISVVVVLFIYLLLFAPRLECVVIEVSKSKHDFKEIEGALLVFKRDNGRYPTEEEGLKALLENPNEKEFGKTYHEGAYAYELPLDQNGNMYTYKVKNLDGEQRVYLRNEVTGEDNVSSYESESVEKMKITAC